MAVVGGVPFPNQFVCLICPKPEWIIEGPSSILPLRRVVSCSELFGIAYTSSSSHSCMAMFKNHKADILTYANVGGKRRREFFTKDTQITTGLLVLYVPTGPLRSCVLTPLKPVYQGKGKHSKEKGSSLCTS